MSIGAISRPAVVAAAMAATLYGSGACPCRADTAKADTHDLSRYQVIIEKSPFGNVAGAGPADAQPNFSQQYALVGLGSFTNSTRLYAMIQDKQRNRTVFKAEGEAIDDVTVLKIERSPTKVTLKKGLEIATLTLEERGRGPAATAGAMPQQPGMPMPGGAQAAPVRRIPFRRGG